MVCYIGDMILVWVILILVFVDGEKYSRIDCNEEIEIYFIYISVVVMVSIGIRISYY